MNLKRFHIALLLQLLLFGAGVAHAQESTSSFNALKLPTSTHAAALGGRNISLIDDDAALGWTNPALYANVSDRTVALDFMTYISSSAWMGAQFVKAVGERHSITVLAQYMNYGSMDETDESGNVLGTFSAKDIIVGAGYSYLLSDCWAGGANCKFLVSNISDYTAVAMSLDLGLNYFDAETDLSISAALQNLGIQLKPYDDGLRAHVPLTLELGLTKGLAHLPARIHVTLTDLTRWRSSYYTLPDADSESLSFGRKALNHVVLGLDILPADCLYLSLGYNFRRAYELKASGSSHLAGFSAGGGLHIRAFSFGISYAKYHQAGNSLMFSASYAL